MNDYKKMKLKDIKNLIFEGQFNKFPYLKKFKKNPYTFLKARYYMYASVLLVYILLKTRITPNIVTIAYGLCGIFGGILLSIHNPVCNIIGVFIFFNKSILDWSDGYLARIKYKTTLTGHILDVYGATLNSVGLTIGLGFFAINQTGYDILIFPLAVAAFLYGDLYTSFGKKVIFDDLNKIIKDNQNNLENIIDNPDHKVFSKKNPNKYPKWVTYLKGFLDDRARSTDLILLVIIIDIYFNYTISLYVFLLVFTRLFFRFLYSFYFGVKSRWAELIISQIDIKNNIKND